MLPEGTGHRLFEPALIEIPATASTIPEPVVGIDIVEEVSPLQPGDHGFPPKDRPAQGMTAHDEPRMQLLNQSSGSS